MDFITTGVIASTVYDLLKRGLDLSAGSLKEKFAEWIKDDDIAESVATELKTLGVSNEMNQGEVLQRLEASPLILGLIREFNAKASISAPSTVTHVTQTHNGNGDNIAGNKITHD